MITKKVQKNFILLLEKVRKNAKDYKIYETKNIIDNLSKILFEIAKKDKKILKEFKISDLEKNNQNLNQISKNKQEENEKAKKIVKWYIMFPNFRNLFIYIWLIDPNKNEKNIFNTLSKCYDIFVESKKEKIVEVAPPSKEIERFIKNNKENFRKRYGKNWEKILYATAWRIYNNKKEK